jgi:hypothetical protein
VILALAGCGGDSDPPDQADAAPPPDVAVPDVMDISGEYDDPTDFDQLGCVPGGFAGLDPTGVWHQDIHLDVFGDFPAATRFDPSATGFTAMINGRATDDVRLTDDYLFVRLAYESGGGDHRVRTLYACARADTPLGAESVTGKLAWCQGGGCLTGSFVSVQIERLPGESEAQGISLVSEWAGDPASPWPVGGSNITVNVRVLDGIAYVARYADGLRIVDVSDPAAPADLGWAPVGLPDIGEIYNDLKITDGPTGRRYALMASTDRGVVVVDVTDPLAPVERGTIREGEGVHTLFLETIAGQTRAYLANTSSVGLDVYDVTDPETPAFLGAYVDAEVETNFSAYLHDLSVQDGLAYLNYWDLGFIIVDANDASNITKVGQYRDYERRTSHSNWVTTTGGGQKIAVLGDEDFTAHMHIVDVDPASPTYMGRLGELSLRPEVSIHNIMASGDLAYVAWYQDGLRIVDVSDPTNPTVVAWYNTWDGRSGVSFYEAAIGLDLDLDANLIYLADTARGLFVLQEQ